MTDATPADLGVRVVVRHALPEGGATDVLGYLVSWVDGVIVLETRRGPVQVAEAAVQAVKRIPEPPVPMKRGPRQ